MSSSAAEPTPACWEDALFKRVAQGRRLVPIATLATLFIAATAAPASFSLAALDMGAEPMAVDQDVAMNGVQLACTGIGDTRADPKWAAYPIRVEFSNAKNEYVTDALVALADAKGEAVLAVRCDGPWLLLKPPPGTYAVYAELVGSSARMRSARFTVPAHGQKRVVLQFPDS